MINLLPWREELRQKRKKEFGLALLGALLLAGAITLGTAFPEGLLVVQDGRNIAPEERQNFKYVSWADVVGALEPE
jgi:Tfp pilus assembly protein PilN